MLKYCVATPSKNNNKGKGNLTKKLVLFLKTTTKSMCGTSSNFHIFTVIRVKMNSL